MKTNPISAYMTGTSIGFMAGIVTACFAFGAGLGEKQRREAKSADDFDKELIAYNRGTKDGSKETRQFWLLHHRNNHPDCDRCPH